MTTSCGLALLSGAQGPCPNMYQEEGKRCPSLWPGGGGIPKPKPSGFALCLIPASLDGDVHRVPGGREEMLALMLPPCPTLLPSPTHYSEKSQMLKQSAWHWVAVTGPPSQSGQQGCPSSQQQRTCKPVNHHSQHHLPGTPSCGAPASLPLWFW